MDKRSTSSRAAQAHVLTAPAKATMIASNQFMDQLMDLAGCSVWKSSAEGGLRRSRSCLHGESRTTQGFQIGVK